MTASVLSVNVPKQVTKFYQANSIINSLVDQTIKKPQHISTIYVSLQLNKSVDSLINRKFFCNNFGKQLILKVFEKLIDEENKFQVENMNKSFLSNLL